MAGTYEKSIRILTMAGYQSLDTSSLHIALQCSTCEDILRTIWICYSVYQENRPPGQISKSLETFTADSGS